MALSVTLSTRTQFYGHYFMDLSRVNSVTVSLLCEVLSIGILTVVAVVMLLFLLLYPPQHDSKLKLLLRCFQSCSTIIAPILLSTHCVPTRPNPRVNAPWERRHKGAHGGRERTGPGVRFSRALIARTHTLWDTTMPHATKDKCVKEAQHEQFDNARPSAAVKGPSGAAVATLKRMQWTILEHDPFLWCVHDGRIVAMRCAA